MLNRLGEVLFQKEREVSFPASPLDQAVQEVLTDSQSHLESLMKKASKTSQLYKRGAAAKVYGKRSLSEFERRIDAVSSSTNELFQAVSQSVNPCEMRREDTPRVIDYYEKELRKNTDPQVTIVPELTTLGESAGAQLIVPGIAFLHKGILYRPYSSDASSFTIELRNHESTSGIQLLLYWAHELAHAREITHSTQIAQINGTRVVPTSEAFPTAATILFGKRLAEGNPRLIKNEGFIATLATQQATFNWVMFGTVNPR